MSVHVKEGYRKSLLPDIKFKGKKICLLTNYRTGSTFFIRETFLTNRILPTEEWEHFNTDKSFEESLQILKDRDEFVFKIMPDQIDLDKTKLKKVLNECDEVIYLYRRDFEAQARGWIAWNLSGDHEHHWGESKTYHIKVTQDLADWYANELIDNYKFMNYAFKKRSGPVYVLEDFPIQIPYSRIYNWEKNVTIPDFNTHKEVFRT
jgi:hypothetical protein